MQASAAAALPLILPGRAFAAEPQQLTIASRVLEVNGKAAKVYGLSGPDGKPGLTLDAGSMFDVALNNTLKASTIIHWHGLEPPYGQDGVAGFPLPALKAGEVRNYAFNVGPGGTFWMHAHTLQEQNLLAAPLIVRTAEDKSDDRQEVVMLLHDFSFQTPQEILASLTGKKADGDAMQMDHSKMDMSSSMKMDNGMAGMSMGDGMAMDINDFDYDAYLANDRTLDDPDIIKIETGGRVRLRIINAAAATNFTIDLGDLQGELVAVDGHRVTPLKAKTFPLSMAQRADIFVDIPKNGGAFPVLALREGAVERTGIILATSGAKIVKLATSGGAASPVLDLSMEAMLSAAKPLAKRKADQEIPVHLTGNMENYSWSMNDGRSIMVRKGQRVEMTMHNMSMMSHPMHLHGHHFQVVAIDGKRFSGANRDTVLVPQMKSVTVAVDTDNPGKWMFHCHHLYHMVSGMMVEFDYDKLT